MRRLGWLPWLACLSLALERAKAEMQAAAHDFGGHREEAPTACDAAIAQLKLVLQYASPNNTGAPAPTP